MHHQNPVVPPETAVQLHNPVCTYRAIVPLCPFTNISMTSPILKSLCLPYLRHTSTNVPRLYRGFKTFLFEILATCPLSIKCDGLVPDHQQLQTLGSYDHHCFIDAHISRYKSRYNVDVLKHFGSWSSTITNTVLFGKSKYADIQQIL